MAGNAPLMLNQSALLMFMKCPEKARRVFLEKEFSPVGLPAHRGMAVHEASKANFSQKIKTRSDLKKKDIIDIGIEALRKNVSEQGVHLDDEEKSVGLKKLLNETEKTVKSMSSVYAAEIAPQYQPAAVEIRHEFELPGELNITIHGQIDMETEDNRIFDLKTVGSSKSAHASSLQFIMYPLLYYLRYQRHARAVVIERIIEGRRTAKRGERIVLPQRSESDYAALLEQTIEVGRMIRAGVFPGAYGDPAAWWCSKKYCAFWRTCRFVPESERR